MRCVPQELLCSLAEEARKAGGSARPNGVGQGQFDLDGFIAQNFPEAKPESWKDGTKWILDHCPFNLDHTGTSAAILRTVGGVIAFKCQHNGCSTRTWADLRTKLEGTRPASDSGREKQNIASTLVSLAADCAKFHTPDGAAFIFIDVKGHREVWPVRSKSFQRYLKRMYYETFHKVPPAQAVVDAVGMVESIAVFDGPTRPVHVRVADFNGRVYVDLADELWRAIEITAEGWRIVTCPPVAFSRAPGMLALPDPIHGESIKDLRPFVRLSGDHWVLSQAWLVAALLPGGPYPVLPLIGSQGASKSTTQRLFRSLIDPNSSPLRSCPRDERDLVIAAKNGHVISLDNVSHIDSWLSDALCRISTGGGYSTRELYSDDVETIFSHKRPIVFNGIEEMVTRGDLLDRSIVIELEPLRENRRRTESELFTEFDLVRPGVLGALLDAVSTSIRNRPTTHLEAIPRMADFAVSIVAAEPALDAPPGAFLEAYRLNRRDAIATSVDASVIGGAIRDFMATREPWLGTATELLKEMSVVGTEETRRTKGFPRTASALSNAVRRATDGLSSLGILVEFLPRERGRRPIRLTRENLGETPSPPSPPSQDVWDQWIASDGAPTECDSGTERSSPDNPFESSVNNDRDGGDGDSRSVSLDDVNCAAHDGHRLSWRISPLGGVVCLTCHPNPVAAGWPRP